jgi:hypothetical protein
MGLWAVDRVYGVRLMSLQHSESIQTLDLKICDPGLISRRGMFQSNRGHLLKDGLLGFYETVIYSRVSVAGSMTGIQSIEGVRLI